MNVLSFKESSPDPAAELASQVHESADVVMAMPTSHAVDFGQIAMVISRGPDCKINADCQSSYFGQLGRPLANPQMGGLGTGLAALEFLPSRSFYGSKKKFAGPENII